MRASHRLERSDLTAVADGRTLEAVIGDLQSEWGVPQNPQEYRITLKVADERALPGERVAVEEVREERPARPAPTGAGPRREKAPAAPRIAADGSDGGSGAAKRKRSRRRRGRRSGSGGG